MPLLRLTNKFGGLNNREAAHLLSPETAQDLSNATMDDGTIQARNAPGASVHTAGGGTVNVYKFAGTWIDSAINYQYAEFGGNVYRAAASHAAQKSQDGITWYGLGVAAPAGALTATATAGLTSNLTANSTYTYYVTFVGTPGGESIPGPGSAGAQITNPANQHMVLSAIPVSGDAQVTARNIYRSGGNVPGISFVAQLADNVTTTYTDNIADSSLTTLLQSATYGVPGQLAGLVVTAFGVWLGWIGSTLYYSEPALPDAWPALNKFVLPETIVGLIPTGGAVLILTVGGVYTLIGSSDTAYQLVNSRAPVGAVAAGRDTIIDMGPDGVYLLAPQGLISYLNGMFSFLYQSGLSDAFMATITGSSTLRAARNGNRYLLFHDAGFLEWTPTITPPWNKGSLGTQVSACHWNKTDAALYVLQGTAVGKWEAGSPLTYTWQTADFIGTSYVSTIFARRLETIHTGSISLKALLDGTQVGATKALTRATIGKNVFMLPLTAKGNRLSVIITGTGQVKELLAEMRETGVPYAGE